VGEALVSFLDEKGIPGVVERAMILPPHSQIGPITPDQRQQIIKNSLVYGTYENATDRESAYERLKGRAEQPVTAAQVQQHQEQEQNQPWYAGMAGALGSLGLGAATGGRRGDTVAQAMVKSAARSIGSTVGRQIVRGVLGSLLGGSSRR
jgi:DNA helicase HerA-like ATPase